MYEDLEILDATEIAEKLHTMLDETLATSEVNDLDRRIFSTYLTDASKTFVQVTIVFLYDCSKIKNIYFLFYFSIFY